MPVGIGQVVLAAATGAAAGLVHFGGLWLTVRRVPTARRPWLLVLGSFAARTAVVAAAIVAVGRQHLSLVAVALAALIVVRTILVRRLGPQRTATGP